MALEQNRETVRAFNEDVWGKGQIELVDKLFAQDFLDHYQAPGGPPGREGIKYDVQRVRSAFPDLVVVTEDIVCEGDRAALRWSGRGTYQGGIPGVVATGRQVTMSGMHFYRLRDGQIIERWDEFDRATVMQQLTGE